MNAYKLHRLYSRIWLIFFAALIIYPVMSFGVTDPQHHTNILIVWFCSLVPLALYFTERRFILDPYSNRSASFMRFMVGLTQLICIVTGIMILLLSLSGSGEGGIFIAFTFLPASIMLTILCLLFELVIVPKKRSGTN